MMLLSSLASAMGTVFGLASGRYIPKGGRPDLLSPPGHFFPPDSMERPEMRSATQILMYYDWLPENLENLPSIGLWWTKYRGSP